MDIMAIILLSLSLSVDTLAVSLGGSVSLGNVRFAEGAKVSLAFGIMQAALIFLGWLLGASVASFIHKAAHVIGFLILLYIGGSMIWSALKKSDEQVDLKGVKRLLMAAFSTSVDAFSVGISLAISGMAPAEALTLTAAVFVMTVIAAALGVSCGSVLGRRFGVSARVIGGLVLIYIGVRLLV